VTHRQTDRATDRPRYIGNNRLHLYVRSTAMRRKKKFADFRRNRSTQTVLDSGRVSQIVNDTRTHISVQRDRVCHLKILLTTF